MFHTIRHTYPDALHDQISASPIGGWSVRISHCRTAGELEYLHWEITASSLMRPLHTACMKALSERAGELGYELRNGRVYRLELVTN